MMPTTPQISWPEDFRVYYVLALTVQTNLKSIVPPHAVADEGIEAFLPTAETRTIIQSGGRLGAQACHVTDKISTAIIKQYLKHELQRPDAYKRIKKTVDFWEAEPGPTTRIIKVARDSFELNHVYNLLKKAGVMVWDFEDTNPDVYGEGVAMRTAIGTEPMSKEDTIGLIDYLPLWNPEGVDKVPTNL